MVFVFHMRFWESYITFYIPLVASMHIWVWIRGVLLQILGHNHSIGAILIGHSSMVPCVCVFKWLQCNPKVTITCNQSGKLGFGAKGQRAKLLPEPANGAQKDHFQYLHLDTCSKQMPDRISEAKYHIVVSECVGFLFVSCRKCMFNTNVHFAWLTCYRWRNNTPTTIKEAFHHVRIRSFARGCNLHATSICWAVVYCLHSSRCSHENVEYCL